MAYHPIGDLTGYPYVGILIGGIIVVAVVGYRLYRSRHSQSEVNR